jgi:hypothetical protein
VAAEGHNPTLYSLDRLIEETRRLATDYRQVTGLPLPVTGEIANYDAAHLLGLELIQPPPGGYDAVGLQGPRAGVRYQIKGRAIFDESKSGHRIGQLKSDQPWDALLLVLLDDSYHPTAIYEADRHSVLAAAAEAEGRRGKRGAMSIARFRNIAQLVWSSESGEVHGEIWTHEGNS